MHDVSFHLGMRARKFLRSFQPFSSLSRRNADFTSTSESYFLPLLLILQMKFRGWKTMMAI